VLACDINFIELYFSIVYSFVTCTTRYWMFDSRTYFFWRKIETYIFGHNITSTEN